MHKSIAQILMKGAIVFTVFEISESVSFKVKVVDSLNAVVDDQCLKDVVKLYHQQERFYLEVVYEVNFAKTIKIVTPFVSIEKNLAWSTFP